MQEHTERFPGHDAREIARRGVRDALRCCTWGLKHLGRNTVQHAATRCNTVQRSGWRCIVLHWPGRGLRFGFSQPRSRCSRAKLRITSD